MKYLCYVIDLGQWKPGKKRISLMRGERPEIKVLAKCVNQEIADMLAQSYSFARHQNAIYGLFGIFVGNGTELEEFARGHEFAHEIFEATASFR